MKVYSERFKVVQELFPQLNEVLEKLQTADIKYLIGGSVSLYLQGNARLPNDVDLMFLANEHVEANKLFGIEIEYIERPNVSMSKSKPLDNGVIDFLSNYTVMFAGQRYFSPPKERVGFMHDGQSYDLVPAEKITLYKLIGRRLHHNDIEDVNRLVSNPTFDKNLFWDVAESIDAVGIVKSLAKQYQIAVPKR